MFLEILIKVCLLKLVKFIINYIYFMKIDRFEVDVDCVSTDTNLLVSSWPSPFVIFFCRWSPSLPANIHLRQFYLILVN